MGLSLEVPPLLDRHRGLDDYPFHILQGLQGQEFGGLSALPAERGFDYIYVNPILH